MDINSLNRFIDAQDRMYQTALSEIKSGHKYSHWIWFIFPQLRGLGRSNMSYAYGISGRKEAEEYLAHPILSERLIEISEALLTHKGKNIYAIMGGIDTKKLKSSMTLFAHISEEGSVFHQVLESFFDGEMDEITLRLLK